MSVEAATEAAVRRNPDSLAEELIGLSEKERRSLHSTLMDITNTTPSPNRDEADLDRCFFIALWGTGTSRDLRNAFSSWRFVPDHRLAEVVASRPQRTIDALVKASLRDDWNRGPWFVVRDLTRQGIIEHLDNEAYYSGLARALPLVVGPRRNEHHSAPIAEAIVEKLVEDVRLRRELFDALDHEEAVHWITGPYIADAWLLAFKKAVEVGVLDRTILLDRCLEGQLRDLRKSASSFFRKLFESLEPTLDEKSVRSDRFIRILAAPHPSEQAGAAKALLELHRAGVSIDMAAVASSVAVPMSGRHKGAAMAALKLVAAMPRTSAERSSAAVHGLGHPHADVQEASLRILEDHGTELPIDVLAEMMLWVDAVAPSLRERVAGLVGVDTGMTDDTISVANIDERLTRFCERPTPGTNLVELIEAGRRGQTPGPLVFDPWSLPAGGSRVEPIVDVDDLVATLTVVLAGSGTPVDLERVIDGLSRFDPSTIPAAALSPVRAMFRDDYEIHGWYGWEVRGKVEVAARHWCAGRRPEVLPYLSPNGRRFRRPPSLSHDLTKPPRDAEGQWWAAAFDGSSYSAGILGFLSTRLWEAVTAAMTAPHPTLSLPSTTMGWLDPNDLVERLEDLHRRGSAPGRFDAMQSLYRLRPGPVDEALLSKLPTSPIMAAVRAFHGSQEPVSDPGLARAVARPPRPSAIRLVSFPAKKHSPEITILRYDSGQATPELRRDDPAGHLLAELAPPTERPNIGTRWTPSVSALFVADQLLVDWTLIGLPRDRDIVAARSAALLAEDLDANRSSDCLHSLLIAATPPDVPLTFAMHVLLATGLADRNVVTGSSAADLLHDAASDGRLDAPLLGRQLCDLTNGGLVKPTRFAKACATVVPASPLVAERVREVLCAWLAGLDGMPRDVHAALETVELACSVSGSGIGDEPARLKLTEAAIGSSKRAKSARRLLELPCESSPAIAALATSALLDRADRWAGFGAR